MQNAVAGLGLAPDAAMVTFPFERFLPGSDIGPIETRKREFYAALTEWASALARPAGGPAPLITVEGRTDELLAEAERDLGPI